MASLTGNTPSETTWSALDLALRGLLADEERHRLANNLQLIIGNLALQAAGVEFAESQAILSFACAQVAGLGRLHTMLYRPDISGEISCWRYLSELCAHVETLITAPRGHELTLTVTTDAEAASGDRQQMHLLGLVLYELLTNAVKHAFPVHMHGNIRVSLALEEDTLLCTVCDDGAGRVDATSYSTSRGMQYINQLVEEAGGTCAWRFSQRGTIAQFNVPPKRSAKSRLRDLEPLNQAASQQDALSESRLSSNAALWVSQWLRPSCIALLALTGGLCRSAEKLPFAFSTRQGVTLLGWFMKRERG